MKITSLRRLVRPAVVLIVVAALVVFASRVNWEETWRAVRAASPALLAGAAIVNLASLALKAVRWWLFLKAAGAPSLRLALRAGFAGAALNNILLANAGEAARVLLVVRATSIPSQKVLATLALERLTEFGAYAAIFAGAMLLVDSPSVLREMRPYAFGALAAVLLALVYLIRHPERVEAPPLARTGFVQRASDYGRSFFRSLRALSTPTRFVAALAISLAVWLLQIATYHLTAYAANFDIPIIGTVAAVLAVNLGFAVRATPANVGVFQAMYALAAAAFGQDVDAAVAVALLIQAQQILPVTAIGLLVAPPSITAATPSGGAQG